MATNRIALTKLTSASGDIAAAAADGVVVMEAAVGGIGSGSGDAIAVPPPTPWRPESIPKAITSYDDSSNFLKTNQEKDM